jgi:hypothetical protein
MSPLARLVVVFHVRQQDVTTMPLAEQQRGQGIPVGLKLSTVQHVRFAMGSVATSVDRECRRRPPSCYWHRLDRALSVNENMT